MPSQLCMSTPCQPESLHSIFIIGVSYLVFNAQSTMHVFILPSESMHSLFIIGVSYLVFNALQSFMPSQSCRSLCGKTQVTKSQMKSNSLAWSALSFLRELGGGGGGGRGWMNREGISCNRQREQSCILTYSMLERDELGQLLFSAEGTSIFVSMLQIFFSIFQKHCIHTLQIL